MGAEAVVAVVPVPVPMLAPVLVLVPPGIVCALRGVALARAPGMWPGKRTKPAPGSGPMGSRGVGASCDCGGAEGVGVSRDCSGAEAVAVDVNPPSGGAVTLGITVV